MRGHVALEAAVGCEVSLTYKALELFEALMRTDVRLQHPARHEAPAAYCALKRLLTYK